jgi:hypothetical protein
MSAQQGEVLVGHEWETDRLSYHGLVVGVVNAVSHL